jgi:hypothetical protein
MILSYLDLSTAHITLRDNELLGSVPNDVLPVTVTDNGYGYFVRFSEDVPLDDIAEQSRAIGLSDDFIGVLRYAKDNRCFLVNLDADAEQVDGLPVHFW